MAEQFDYIIVGSGSAGSVMAYRLSEAGHTVLVLEYGGTDRGPLIQMPSALSIPMNMKRYNWGFETEPEPHLNGRRLATPRGKVVGGSPGRVRPRRPPDRSPWRFKRLAQDDPGALPPWRNAGLGQR